MAQLKAADLRGNAAAGPRGHVLRNSFVAAWMGVLIGCASGASRDGAIVAAAKSYVVTHTAVTSPHVEVEQVAGIYARAKVWPGVGVKTDAAQVFLKNDHGMWTVLALGTAFGGEDYRRLQIPSVLRP